MKEDGTNAYIRIETNNSFLKKIREANDENNYAYINTKCVF